MRSHAWTRTLVCAGLCLASATACGDGSGSSHASRSANASADPTVRHSAPSPTSRSSAPAATGLVASLLSADAMPGFNDGYRWTAGRTVPESPSGSFGTCQRFSTTSIGAERALVRRFQAATSDPSASHDAAGELVAQFPDPQTARRAFSVLTSWRAGCAERLRGHTRPTLGPLQPVPVDGGTGGWYLLTYGPVPGDPGAQFFDAQGMTVVGDRIAMVALLLAGQDYDYPPGQEPAALAVQRAAQSLS